MGSIGPVRLTLALAWFVAAAGGAAAQRISDDVVKLGVLNDMNSLYADTGGKGSVIAAQMAVADFGGKVAGKPIEVISADHQNKPDVGAAIARRWYDIDKVDAILDAPTSSVALAVQQVTAGQESRVDHLGRRLPPTLPDRPARPMASIIPTTPMRSSNVAGKAMVTRGEQHLVLYYRGLCVRASRWSVMPPTS